VGHERFIGAARIDAEPIQTIQLGRTPAPSFVRPGVSATSLRPGMKRSSDVIIAVSALVLLLPLFLAIALAIKLDSPGPVFFRVRRVGYRGEPLLMLKFRKMRHDAYGGPLTTSADPRLTRVGRLLTRARLDELPQLWDVIWGRMSVVGPRPEDPSFARLHDEAYQAILSVRPGITGLSQLAFAEEQQILEAQDPIGYYVGRILPQKVGLDTLYTESYGLRRDLSVIFWTIVAVALRKPVAVHRATGDMRVRKRPAVDRRAHDEASVVVAKAA
jgi:lipopolysaccharide/colanic/teichoic acid biosynthesis glycosyltransferase